MPYYTVVLYYESRRRCGFYLLSNVHVAKAFVWDVEMVGLTTKQHPQRAFFSLSLSTLNALYQLARDIKQLSSSGCQPPRTCRSLKAIGLTTHNPTMVSRTASGLAKDFALLPLSPLFISICTVKDCSVSFSKRMKKGFKLEVLLQCSGRWCWYGRIECWRSYK